MRCRNNMKGVSGGKDHCGLTSQRRLSRGGRLQARAGRTGPRRTGCGQREAKPGQRTRVCGFRRGHVHLDVGEKTGLTGTGGIWGKGREIHVLGAGGPDEEGLRHRRERRA